MYSIFVATVHIAFRVRNTDIVDPDSFTPVRQLSTILSHDLKYSGRILDWEFNRQVGSLAPAYPKRLEHADPEAAYVPGYVFKIAREEGAMHDDPYGLIRTVKELRDALLGNGDRVSAITNANEILSQLGIGPDPYKPQSN